MTSIWLIYFLSATAASGIFAAAGWRGSRSRGMTSAQNRNALPAQALWDHPASDLTASQADVGIAIGLAMKRLASVMANHAVQTEVAVPPGLLIRMRAPLLADLLEELLTAAIHAAPASRLLLTAVHRGDRIYVTVTDDMPGADPVVRTGSVRGLTERVAMRGGALDIDVSPMEGTSITLRFAAILPGQQDKTCVLPGFAKALPSQPAQAVGQA